MKKLLRNNHNIQSVVTLLALLFLVATCADNPAVVLKKRARAALKIVEVYKFGDSRAWLQELQDVMAEVNNMPEVHKDVEKMMVEVLESDASLESKLIVCKHIGQVGGNYCVPVLEKMLRDPGTQHMAIMALASLSVDGMVGILMDNLDQADNKGKIAIANVLALKPDVSTVGPLSELLSDQDPLVRDAAAHALSAIGGPEPAGILKNMFNTSEGETKWKLAGYWLTSMQNEPTPQIMEACEAIMNAGAPVSLNYRAMSMKLGCLTAADQVVTLFKAFRLAQPEIQQSFIPLVRQLPVGSDLRDFINSMPMFPADIKYQLMVAIADRYDPAIRPVLLEELNKSSVEGRLMALKGLEKVAGSQDLNMLIAVSANGPYELRSAARSCIYWMKDENADNIIVGNAGNSKATQKIEWINAIGYRKIESGKAALITNLNNADKSISQAAIISLGKIGTSSDLQSTLDLMLSNPQAGSAEAIKNAIIAMALNTAEPAQSSQILSAKLATGLSSEASVILIGVLGEIGDDTALEALRNHLNTDNSEVQFAVLKALSVWKDDRPITDLEQILAGSIPPSNRSQAIVGLVVLVQNSRALSADEKVEKLSLVYDSSENTFDKQTLIKGVSRIYSIRALDFVMAHVNDPGVEKEAQEAVIRVAGDLREGFRDEVQAKMTTLLEQNKDSVFEEKIRTLMKSMEL